MISVILNVYKRPYSLEEQYLKFWKEKNRLDLFHSRIKRIQKNRNEG